MSDSRFFATYFTKFARSRNKRLLLGVVASCIFVINILLVLRFLDDSSQISSHSYLQYNHESGLHLPKEPKRIHECKNTSFDSLSASAFKRMKTEECRLKLESFLCSLDSEVAWPVSQIENTCTAHFNNSATYSYVGCFKDSPRSRLLTGYKYNFAGYNNVKMCVQACLRAGYIYAGVEYGVECFCGNDLVGQFKNPLKEKHCESFACPNSDSYCGGYEAIALYLTGIKGNILLITMIPWFGILFV
ncbi:WSC domain-containing protein [Ditylenchus destructor]|uniref:WSC domain-containing protein n=1 Tax=Ditylenchus destructor TaxID=166010 RepID=A0AAD4N9R1_9BILA|nr:WSC domain-containing protein [Ditylenchus destructor]